MLMTLTNLLKAKCRGVIYCNVYSMIECKDALNKQPQSVVYNITDIGSRLNLMHACNKLNGDSLTH